MRLHNTSQLSGFALKSTSKLKCPQQLQNISSFANVESNDSEYVYLHEENNNQTIAYQDSRDHVRPKPIPLSQNMKYRNTQQKKLRQQFIFTDTQSSNVYNTMNQRVTLQQEVPFASNIQIVINTDHLKTPVIKLPNIFTQRFNVQNKTLKQFQFLVPRQNYFKYKFVVETNSIYNFGIKEFPFQKKCSTAFNIEKEDININIQLYNCQKSSNDYGQAIIMEQLQGLKEKKESRIQNQQNKKLIQEAQLNEPKILEFQTHKVRYRTITQQERYFKWNNHDILTEQYNNAENANMTQEQLPTPIKLFDEQATRTSKCNYCTIAQKEAE
ncbi:Hypothetical_protein [Hexamita inflata]|uniref:Hypothetical_protein n=1 Tax=Hexamita inflata TaxID=28002 RepID=A0AA86R476_9EUKA|nr:Hypothetical protein HINF_LOCUS59029 [Hexamita inflata]